jgi:hypothetical protein
VSVSAKEAFQLASDANGGNERPVQWIKEDASQIIERGFNRGDLSVADEICSDALIEHEFSPLTLASNARDRAATRRRLLSGGSPSITAEFWMAHRRLHSPRLAGNHSPVTLG